MRACDAIARPAASGASTPGVPALELAGVTVLRPGGPAGPRAVFRDVSAAFEAGRVAVVTGPTGSGKSTLVALLAGLLRPAEGEVRAAGEAVSRWTAAHRDRWRRQVGLLFQDPRLLDDLTVRENVMLPLVPRGGTLGQAGREVERALAAAGAADLSGRPLAVLSGGQRQRVALARALAGDPAILLLDEPTAHQDDAGVEVVRAIARAARDRGALVLLATHDPRLLSPGLADDRWQAGDGRLARLP